MSAWEVSQNVLPVFFNLKDWLQNLLLMFLVAFFVAFIHLVKQNPIPSHTATACQCFQRMWWKILLDREVHQCGSFSLAFWFCLIFVIFYTVNGFVIYILVCKQVFVMTIFVFSCKIQCIEECRKKQYICTKNKDLLERCSGCNWNDSGSGSPATHNVIFARSHSRGTEHERQILI